MGRCIGTFEFTISSFSRQGDNIPRMNGIESNEIKITSKEQLKKLIEILHEFDERVTEERLDFENIQEIK